MSDTFTYDFTDQSGGADDVVVTVGSLISDTSGFGPSYSVEAISGSIDNVTISGQVGSGGTTQYSQSAVFDNAVFTTGGGAQGSVSGLDYYGFEFKTADGVEYNLYTQAGAFHISPANNFSEDQIITLDSTDAPCFLDGTGILTDQGEKPVELLKAGDLVATREGLMAVKAVTHTIYRGRSQVSATKLRPICIGAGALGEQVPVRDLYVSPNHSMFLNGYLVPAQLLVNGSTITQPARSQRINYFHVEIEPHGILFANGAQTESYLDIGWGDQGSTVALFPGTEPKCWEDACAPLLLDGPELERIRERIAVRVPAAAPQLAKVA